MSRTQKGTQIRQVPEQEKQVYHEFDLVELGVRSQKDDGETQEQFKYHQDEKKFITDFLNTTGDNP